MSAPVVKFNKEDRPEFFKVLRSRVNQHFKDNQLSRHGNLEMKIKTIFMLCLYASPLILMLTGVVTSFWGMILMWVIMGFGMAGIGLAIMHDANHGAYSSNPLVNKTLGFALNFIGGYHVNWIIQHNVLHHSFTNVEGFDEDIDKGIMRFSPDQEHKNIFRFQILYVPVLYSVLTLFWLLVKDFQLLFRYHKKGLLKGQGMSFQKAFAHILFNKIWYVVLTLVLPILLIDLPWTQVLLGFFLMHIISGIVLGLIFQPAHVLEGTNFYKVDDGGSVENSWAIHQLLTTCNFATKSVFFSWYVGGLNFQIEHHLFPNICHVHYKDISKIVQATAAEFNIPYHQKRTFWDAVVSHFTLLHKLGSGKYDNEIIKGSTTIVPPPIG